MKTTAVLVRYFLLLISTGLPACLGAGESVAGTTYLLCTEPSGINCKVLSDADVWASTVAAAGLINKDPNDISKRNVTLQLENGFVGADDITLVDDAVVMMRFGLHDCPASFEGGELSLVHVMLHGMLFAETGDPDEHHIDGAWQNITPVITTLTNSCVK